MSEDLKKSVDQQPQERQERPEQVQQKETRQIQLSTISKGEIEKINDEKQKSQEKQIPKKNTKPQPPVIKNPIKYFKGDQTYNWNLKQINPNSLLQELTVENVSFGQQLPFENDIQLRVVDNEITASTFAKHIYYIVERKDKNGQSKFKRRYTQYLAFRKKLVQLWPIVFIPLLPNKTFIAASEDEIIRNRTKYINHFWRKITTYQQIYYSQQVQLFINATDDVNIESTFEKIEIPNISMLVEKYKNNFNEAYQMSVKEQFMYRKQQAPAILEELELHLISKRKDLNQFKDRIRKMAEAKKNYYLNIFKLTMSVLPEYEDAMLKWFSGQPLEVQEVKKPSRKSTEPQKSSTKSEQNKEENKSQSQKQPQVKQYKQQAISSSSYQGLYNTQGYKSQLQDLQRDLKQYNSSNWLIYDIIKFQLRDLDAVLTCLDKVKQIRKQIDFLTRNITSNKQQLQSVSNKKLSLKTFFMGGSQEEKKSKLTAQNEKFQELLQKYQQFYLIALALIEKQLIVYHQQRISYYQRGTKKIVVDELAITRAILQAHLYEVQIFGKICTTKIRESFPVVDSRHQEILNEQE